MRIVLDTNVIWIVADPLPLAPIEESDRRFLEVAAAAGADAIVTGNTKHFSLRSGRLDVPVLSPRQYIDLLASRCCSSRRRHSRT